MTQSTSHKSMFQPNQRLYMPQPWSLLCSTWSSCFCVVLASSEKPEPSGTPSGAEPWYVLRIALDGANSESKQITLRCPQYCRPTGCLAGSPTPDPSKKWKCRSCCFSAADVIDSGTEAGLDSKTHQ